jgi:AcrR family transcriptional regulator
MRCTVPAKTDDRPLRRDAHENRQRLLDAAAAVFAERGLEAGVEEIAGVGVGTLYRRFPTKDALICALVHDVMRPAPEPLTHRPLSQQDMDKVIAGRDDMRADG